MDTASAIRNFVDGKPHWLLTVLLSVYFIAKVIDYVSLMFLVTNDTLLDALRYFINVPVYVAFLAYLLRFRIPPRIFWKVWVAVAIFDELLMIATDFGSMGYLLELQFIALMLPLYLVAAVYAYRAESIWIRGAGH